MKHKLLAVVGAGGSGKTTTAIKLARELAVQGKRVALLFDEADSFPLGLVVHNYDKNRSLGKILNLNIMNKEAMTFQDIMDQFQTTLLDNLAVCSYALNETKANYVEYSQQVANELIERLLAEETIDYIIVDCATDIRKSQLSFTACMKAQEVFFVMNANTKSLAYQTVNRKLIEEINPAGRIHIVVNNYFPNDPYKTVEKKLERNVIYLPHCMAVANQMTELSLLSDITIKTNGLFRWKSSTKRERLYVNNMKVLAKLAKEGA